MGVHTSFKNILVYPYPVDEVMPTTYVVSGGTSLPGLISASHQGPEWTQIDDTEQFSPGGAKESFPGRSSAIVINAKYTYTQANLLALLAACPGPLNTRVQPANGRRIFELVRIDGVKMRTFGYLNINQGGEGEDDKDVIEVTMQGSGELYVTVPPP